MWWLDNPCLFCNIQDLNYAEVGNCNLAIWTAWTESYSLCCRKTPLDFKRLSRRMLSSVGLHLHTFPSMVTRVLAGPNCFSNTVEFWRWRRYVSSKTHESLFSYRDKLKFEIFTNKKPEVFKWTHDGNVMSFHLSGCFTIGINGGIWKKKWKLKLKCENCNSRFYLHKIPFHDMYYKF